MKNKPNYWYKQSSVIPFRKENLSIEFLIITTRKKKNWTFPKGIIEKNLSAQDSAAKEALEEAGVRGLVLQEKLGKYSYKKWGGKCKVRVYALEVIELLDVWEEDFRERKWVMINELENYNINEKLIGMAGLLLNS